LAQKGLDLIDHVKTYSKDQYVIDIQAQYNSLTATMVVVHTSISLIDTKSTDMSVTSNFSCHSLGACFRPYKDFYNLHTLSS
jgi:hypothetical protein